LLLIVCLSPSRELPKKDQDIIVTMNRTRQNKVIKTTGEKGRL